MLRVIVGLRLLQDIKLDLCGNLLPRSPDIAIGKTHRTATLRSHSDTSADLLKSMNVYPRRMLQVYFIRDVYGCSRLPVCRIP